MKFLIALIFLISFFISDIHSQIKIGAALPLMENSTSKEEKNLGEFILLGVKDALKEYNSSRPKKDIKLIVKDTQKDPAVALDVMNQFGNDKNTIAIFGPVFSNVLAPNAGVGAFHKIPIISPTSTQNNLAKDNEYVYQLNPTYEIRGKLMAKYAMDELGMRNFVILSEENYGKNFAQSFTEEVLANGGRIMNLKYYQRDEVSVSEHLNELKKDILKNEMFIDFGNLSEKQKEKLSNFKNYKYSNYYDLLYKKAIVSIFRIFGPEAVRIKDSLGITAVEYSDEIRNAIPGYVDAIYIPIAGYPEIPKIISQYFSEKINLPILGTSDWNNINSLEENKMYIKELYFDSDFYLSEELKEKMKKSRMNEFELKNYYFGYDGMKMILDQVREGNDTRTSLSNAIDKLYDYPSVHNNITIKNRTNQELSIMKFDGNQLVKVMNYIY